MRSEIDAGPLAGGKGPENREAGLVCFAAVGVEAVDRDTGRDGGDVEEKGCAGHV